MNKNNVFTLFDIPLSTLGLEKTLSLFKNNNNSLYGYICFVNVHSITESIKNNALKNALKSATLCTADGLPLVWISKWFSKKNKIHSRTCGPDFMHLALTQNPEEVFGFIGSTPKTIEKIINKYNLKNTVYFCPPYEEFSKESALKNWNEFEKKCHEKNLKPEKIWVSLGAPKQELWMHTLSTTLNSKNILFLGVGAAFDFLSNEKNRAPLLFQKLGLEWLYRLLQEPKRLFTRYFYTNSVFLWNIIRFLPEIRKNN